MEFLVEFDMNSSHPEAVAAANLAAAGHLVRLWQLPAVAGHNRILGLYRADTDIQLDDILRQVPLAPGVHPAVTQLDADPNDPGAVPLRPPLPPT